MKITAELNNLRMSPRKVRLVADAVRGKPYRDAERTLRLLARRAAGPLEKLLRSAAANAKQNFEITDQNSLVISELRVDSAETLQRRRPRARGRAFPIRKRTSRILLVLEAKGVEAKRGGARPSNIEIVSDVEKISSDSPKTTPDRTALKKQSKPDTRRNFVQRMFQRKAI